MKRKKPRRFKIPVPKVSCPFCWEWLPRAKTMMDVFSASGCEGGRCSCGAVFVMDDGGRFGGEALLDVQALACDGDLDRAMKIRPDIDFELKKQPYQKASDPLGRVRGNIHVLPKAWAIKMKTD